MIRRFRRRKAAQKIGRDDRFRAPLEGHPDQTDDCLPGWQNCITNRKQNGRIQTVEDGQKHNLNINLR